tara:strand:+ start:67658 stop:69562 length:1905 start_codon:yes stop_codon:yes gene_type:complete
MIWTNEQQKIIQAQGNLRVNAIAGSGKTTTILQFAANLPKKSKILYLAFNKSVKTEARQKSLKIGLTNMQVETAHSLAFKYIIRAANYKVCKTGYKPHQLISLLHIHSTATGYVPFLLANHISKFTAYFCNNTAQKIQDLDYRKTISDKKATTFVNNYYKIIEKGTREFLAKMETKEIDCTHDFYLKKFQLSNPTLKYDYILFDEGQDASPAMLDIFLNQDATKIIVGDTHQQIYAWRYAVNSLERVNFKQHNLTASFRFPQDIANVANYALNLKKYLGHSKLYSIKGLGKPPEKIATKAIIARSNLGLLLKAIEYVVENKKAHKIYFEGNINSYTYAEDGTSLYDVLNLYLGKRHLIKDALIQSMHDIEQLEDYIEKTEDVQLAMMLKIVQEYGKEIPHIIKEIKEKHIDSDSKENAEVIFSTVHRSKGMEYDAVYLVNDFINEEKLTKLSKNFLEENREKINEEINLLYVAVTRAKNHLFIPKSLLPKYHKKSPHIHPIKEVVKIKKPEDDAIEEITMNEVMQIMTGKSNTRNTTETVKAYKVVDKKSSTTTARLIHPKEKAVDTSEKAYPFEEIRKKHTQAYQPWTPELDHKLTIMFCEKVSIKSIAQHLGRTPGAINSRIKKLELRELYG